jgi:hypothetical protein
MLVFFYKVQEVRINIQNICVLKYLLKSMIEGEWVVREGVGAGGRNEPSLVCTYE